MSNSSSNPALGNTSGLNSSLNLGNIPAELSEASMFERLNKRIKAKLQRMKEAKTISDQRFLKVNLDPLPSEKKPPHDLSLKGEFRPAKILNDYVMMPLPNSLINTLKLANASDVNEIVQAQRLRDENRKFKLKKIVEFDPVKPLNRSNSKEIGV